MPYKDPEQRRKWREEHRDAAIEASRAWRASEQGKRKRAAYLARKLDELLSNTNHRWHGTVTGYGVGCRCDRCVRARSDYAAGR